jgi:hypothetical protein
MINLKPIVPVFKGSSTSVSMNLTNTPMITITLTNAICLVIGTITLLKQYNPDYRNQFIAYLSQYVRSAISLSSQQKLSDLPVDPLKLVAFLEEMIDFSNLDREVCI